MTIPVKFYHDQMQGAPQISGTAGAFIAMLDACLINGFNSQSFDSIVIAGNTATATKSAGGHGFQVGDVVAVSGAATPAALNAEWTVATTSTTTVIFTTTGISDQTATGTLSIKFAPLGGWTKAFSGTNLAAYKSTALGASGCYIRVDDTSAQQVNIRAYETMSDINTGTNQTPTTVQQTNYGTFKSGTANSTARTWALVGDSRAVYGGICNSSTLTTIFAPFFFGDLHSYKAGDAFSFALYCHAQSSGNNGGGDQGDFSKLQQLGYASNNGYVVRSMDGTGTSNTFGKYSVLPNNSVIGSFNNLTVSPSLSDSGVHLCKVFATDSQTKTNGLFQKRGEFPGMYCPEEYLPGNHLQKVTLGGGVPFICMSIVSTGVSGSNGRVFFSLNDWRA